MKSEQKNTLLTVTLTPDQRAIVEALRDHLELKTNAAVALAGLAELYSKNRRQLEAATTAAAAADGA